MILKSETYHFHRLDLTRQAGFIVTIYDEEGLRLVSTSPPPTPAQAFAGRAKGLPVETMCGLTQAYTWRKLVALQRRFGEVISH